MITKVKMGLLMHVVLLLFACEKATDFYLGVNQQPDIVEDTYEEGLNILAILRPDAYDNQNRSFVFIQQLSPALANREFEFIADAEVRILTVPGKGPVDTVELPLMLPDANYRDTLYRSESGWQPLPKMTYRLVCKHPEFPEAWGEATFPPPPEVVEESLLISGSNVEFAVKSDTLIKLIDVYFSGHGQNGFLGRFVPNDSTSLLLEVNLPVPPTGTILTIYGYEANLTNYYANSNTSLNFNKYRTTISTLESGYGVFGALNFTELELD